MILEIKDRSQTLQAFLSSLPAKPLVLETGCMRPGATDDGSSTLLFGTWLRDHGGRLISVDISPDNVAYAREQCKGLPVEVVLSDSLTFLKEYKGPAFNGVYLDSLDTDQPGHQEHCLAEAQAALAHLAGDGVVLLDDNHKDGKPVLALPWLLKSGLHVQRSGYQVLLGRKVVKPTARPFSARLRNENLVDAGNEIHLAGVFNGIGDALLGLHAVAGAKAKWPDKKIVYHTKQPRWVELFDGYDALAPLYQGLKARNINDGYGRECATKAKVERWRRYCINAGGVDPVVPSLRDREAIMREGRPYEACAALVIRSVYNNRNYPHWLRVEKLLMEKGYKTVILHDNPAHMKEFQGEKYHGHTPREIAGVLLNAGVVIGVDTGLSHLAALLGKRPIVLCGPCLASKVYYCPIIEVTGPGGHQGRACAGCFWQGPSYPACGADSKGCSSLASISPVMVMEKIGA